MRPLRSPGTAAVELTRLCIGSIAQTLERTGEGILHRGAYGAPITTGPDRTVLLFYEDVERDRFLRGDRHLRRSMRRVYHALTEGQRVSGFERAFLALRLALTRAGCRVVVNNEQLARANPRFPIGICGYPHILEHSTLPNPAILGPGLFDHPAQAPQLMDDPRYRSYLVPCDWMADMFGEYYGPERCPVWFAGFDLAEWPDLSDQPKDIDVLLYDKIRWDRPEMTRTVLEPIRRELTRRGLAVTVVQRGAYDLASYLRLLGRARGMLFVCEHETQGLAYQEAMACNVPILAWDNGYWLDPVRTLYTPDPVPASSVPYFAAECGERFASAEEFPAALDRFLAGLAGYTPRRFVADRLSLERSARLYLDAYTAAV